MAAGIVKDASKYRWCGHREILAWLGVVAYGFKVKEIAAGFQKYGETASRLVSMASHRRVVDQDFADRVGLVDSAIAKEES